MNDISDRPSLLLSLQRALLNEVHPELRQVSIEANAISEVVRLRFEYDGVPTESARESCSCVSTEVISDFPAPWDLEEDHISVPYPHKLSALAHVAYRRWEPERAA